jgi:hypothetical protein
MLARAGFESPRLPKILSPGDFATRDFVAGDFVTGDCECGAVAASV